MYKLAVVVLLLVTGCAVTPAPPHSSCYGRIGTYKVSDAFSPEQMEGIFQAATEWERATKGEVSWSFEVVSGSDYDDWSISLEDIRHYGNNVGTKIKIDSREDMDQDRVFKTMLHEFGHSVWIRHSEDPNSTMYYRVGATTITKDTLEEFNKVDCGGR